MATVSFTACASDEAPTDDVPNEEDVPFDPDVDDGIDTEVDKSENLEFDGDDA